MPAPLLSATALASIRKIGEAQLTTLVKIIRPVPVVQDPTQMSYDPNYDFGDDDDTFEIYEGAETTYNLASAWFHSTIQSTNVGDDQAIRTIDLHEIRFAVGTDVRVQDIIERVDTGEQWVVIDTNALDTWAEKLRVHARRAE